MALGEGEERKGGGGAEMPEWVPHAHIFGTLLFYIMGVTLVMLADCQKNVLLANIQHRPLLIANGLWGRTRNPNYFGEIMLYLSFAMMTNHIISYMIVGWAIGFVYAIRMYQKELSLRQKPGYWDDYVHKSNLLIPKILGGWLDHLVVLAVVVLTYKYVLSYTFVGFAEVKWPF